MLRVISIIIATIAFSQNAQADTTNYGWWLSSNTLVDATNQQATGNRGYEALHTTSYLNNANGSWSQDGSVGLTVTAWSNSAALIANNHDGYDDVKEFDENVTQAELYLWNGGLGVVNNDEYDRYGNPLTGTEHSVDNKSHQNKWSDQDMILLSFDTAVSLDGVKFGWQNSQGDNVMNFGVVAISDNSAAGMASGGEWSAFYSANSMFKNTSTEITNHQQYYSLDADLTAPASGSVALASKHWLVGLYNDMENCNYDGFKLLGVTASVGQSIVEVSEPGSLALLALGFGLMIRRKSRLN